MTPPSRIPAPPGSPYFHFPWSPLLWTPYTNPLRHLDEESREGGWEARMQPVARACAVTELGKAARAQVILDLRSGFLAPGCILLLSGSLSLAVSASYLLLSPHPAPSPPDSKFLPVGFRLSALNLNMRCLHLSSLLELTPTTGLGRRWGQSTNVRSAGGTRAASLHNQLLSRAGSLFIACLWPTAGSRHRFNPLRNSIPALYWVPSRSCSSRCADRDSGQWQKSPGQHQRRFQKSPAEWGGGGLSSWIQSGSRSGSSKPGLFLAGTFSQIKQSTPYLLLDGNIAGVSEFSLKYKGHKWPQMDPPVHHPPSA